MMIKLIVSDIDGTLIGGDEKLPAKADEVLRKVRAKGIHFTLATGRSDCIAVKFADYFKCRSPFVTTNGAAVIDASGKTFLRLCFPISRARDIIETADERGLAVLYSIKGEEYVLDGERKYIKDNIARFPHYSRVRKLTDMDWKSLSVDKVSIMTDSDDASISLLESMCEEKKGEFSYTRYMDRSVELVAPDVSKANGVEYVASLMGVGMDEVMFIGDHQNDISLMRASGLGIAVGNATRDAKENADYVCSNYLFDGVEEAINKFVLGEK